MRTRISRPLRDKYENKNISPFTRQVREQEYLALYETSRPKLNVVSHHLQEKYKKYIYISEVAETIDFLNVTIIQSE